MPFQFYNAYKAMNDLEKQFEDDFYPAVDDRWHAMKHKIAVKTVLTYHWKGDIVILDQARAVHTLEKYAQYMKGTEGKKSNRIYNRFEVFKVCYAKGTVLCLIPYILGKRLDICLGQIAKVLVTHIGDIFIVHLYLDMQFVK